MWHVALAVVMATATATPGYVDDAACGNCHADKWETYRHVGMAKAFHRPRADRFIEDFDAPPFFHERSGQYFEMRRSGEEIVFRRWKLASDGAPIHVFEQKVDWILGSGHHSRTYIYRTPGGELHQLPIAWYTATREWRMAPGYDRADHDGVMRRVRHECMFCHNAYPDIAEEKLSYWRSQSFPPTLPEGIGCQRCHGPGAKHIETAKAKADVTQVRATIVNPIRLGTRLRNDVCYECHMQPTVVLPGVRRFGRDIYSFRPGQPLAEYAVPVDIEEADMPRAERFEINHHPYRLERSRCFIESEGRLSCLTCHDPHKKITDAAHFRRACMSCHTTAHRPTEDCTSCHMPKRRPQDVVHVVMTDHFIRRTPGGPELLAMREEREPLVTRVDATDELYGVLTLVRSAGGADAVRRLEQLMMAMQPTEVEPYLDLASTQLRQRRWQELERTAVSILGRDPKQELAREWLGLARAGRTGNAEDAIRILARLDRPEAVFNLGVLLAEQGRMTEAIVQYERVLAARPNLAAAWFRLGEARQECGDGLGAIDAFRRALEIEPSHACAQSAIVDALRAMGNTAEAERFGSAAAEPPP